MEMRRKIQALEQARDRELQELAVRYRPVSLFREPVLQGEAYEMYAADSVRVGLLPLPRAEGGLRHAMETFAPIVRENKVLSFHVDREISALTRDYKHRQAGKLRSLLAALAEVDAGSAPTYGADDGAAATKDDGAAQRPDREDAPDPVVSSAAGAQKETPEIVIGRPGKRPKHVHHQ